MQKAAGGQRGLWKRSGCHRTELGCFNLQKGGQCDADIKPTWGRGWIWEGLQAGASNAEVVGPGGF